ncbi:hypothetical protein KDN24_06125 [Bacillus sp. Bva_UNVM-123]|uniref:homing endonuclease associated repeat-containing protein n=1 Tax=Bacillus sp. Bva_UNVM-123 TaxID=2829798 RepID=UPI00391F898F
MAIVEGQKVKVKWNGKHKKYYESILDEYDNQKYFWKGNAQEFEVDLIDLPKNSQADVLVECDYCSSKLKKKYISYLRSRENNFKHGIHKDCCDKCYSLKMREINGTLDELDFTDTEPTSQNIYTRDFLISEFYRYKNENGTYPKKSDINGTDGYPSAEAYNTNWGTWGNFLKDIGVLGDFGWYKEDEDVIKELYPKEYVLMKEINGRLIVKRSIYELQKIAQKMGLKKRNLLIAREYDINLSDLEIFYESLNDLKEDVDRCPVVMDYDAYTKLNKITNRRLIEKKLNKSFGEICTEIFDQSNKIKSDDELLNELRDLKYKLGRTPRANELKLYGLAEHKTYRRRFNMTYQELIDTLGWELASPRMRFKSEEEMLADYERLHNELGRLPNEADLLDCEYICSYQTYNTKFGSLQNVWDILELVYNPNQKMSAGYVCINKNNEICRSSSELAISNIFIDNAISYIPELKYSDFDSSLKSRWLMDWYLKDYDIYVEYFGMYQESQLKRNTRIGKYSRKAKRKINYCNKNNIKLISLYREDLTHNFKGMYEEFLENGIKLNIRELIKKVV